MNLGSILGAIVGVVLMATGVGVVAGAMLLASSLASAGVIGGSIGKFMNSGLGRGLMAAVSLGSMAYAMYGETATQAGVTAAQNASVTADLHATVGNTLASDASAISTDAATTNTSFLQSVQATQEVSQTAAATQALGNISQESKLALNAATPENGGLMGASSSQASGAATATDTAAVKSGQGLVQPGVDPAVSHGYASTSGVPAGEGAPGAAGLPEGMAPHDAEGALEDSTNAGYTGPSPTAPEGASSGWGGTLMKALDTKGGSALIQGGGSMLGGIGQGMAQKQATEDYIKAQQWGNMQWQNQSQVDNMQAAAARPITVPQGYLQRAQQTRALMQGNQGMQPLPAASPGAPLAPSPVHI